MGGDIVLDPHYKSGIKGCPGARFSVILNRPPLALDSLLVENDKSAHPDKRPSEEETVEELPERCSVLFVDDDTLLRRLFSRSVSKVKPNWIIQEAANGETALELTAKNEYDIIFMDHYMSSAEKQLLGTETVRALRARGVKSRICGLSANDMQNAFLEAGADAFLLKPLPCKPDALQQALVHVLQNDRLEELPGEGEMERFGSNALGSDGSTIQMDTEDKSERLDI